MSRSVPAISGPFPGHLSRKSRDIAESGTARQGGEAIGKTHDAMKHPGPERLAKYLPLAPWVVLVLGLAGTAWLTASAYEEMRARDQERFRHATAELTAQVDSHLRRYGQALMGMRDWFAGHTEMTESLWTNHVYTMHMPAHYPGLYEVGFVEQVMDINSPSVFPSREAHLDRIRKRLGPSYNFHLPPGGQEGFSWYHMPVIWHSYGQWRRDPVRDYRHYGMDLNQNPDLWAAMNWALGQDMPAISGKQAIDPDNPSITGLLTFLPVYRSGMDRNFTAGLTDYERRSAALAGISEEVIKQVRHYQHFLRGLIFGGIDIRAFIEAHIATNASTVAFALYASTNHLAGALPEQILFDSRDAARTPSLREVRDLPFYGRVLRFAAEPGPAFASAVNQRTLWLAASFGVATTLLLAGFIGYQTRAHQKEWEIAAALRQSEAKLQALLHERECMSRDLHDGTIQSLYALGLGLGRLRKTWSNIEERQRLEASLTELDHVVTELRGYLVTLDPGVSPVQPAGTALKELVARLRQTAATELRFSAEPGIGDGWPPAFVLDLLQTAREGIGNALRHGQATRVDLELKGAGSGEVLFTIKDNGKGFDPSVEPRKEGHGLFNLERRARAWQGSIRIESAPGGPTCLTFAAFPFERPAVSGNSPDPSTRNSASESNGREPGNGS
jgi:signal transduction histidine kinase